MLSLCSGAGVGVPVAMPAFADAGVVVEIAAGARGFEAAVTAVVPDGVAERAVVGRGVVDWGLAGLGVTVPAPLTAERLGSGRA